MDFPNIHGISDIQETQAMSGSRNTLAISPRSNMFFSNQSLESYLNNQNQSSNYIDHNEERCAPTFHELREYAEKTLSSWGLKIGYMTQNAENMLTIKCLVQLIQQKYKDQQSREQLKKSLANALFERNKYSSLLEQERSITMEKNKAIGRLQNLVNDYKIKLKNLEQLCKKQKQEDKKMVSMLKSKNEQIMHEIKKKEQQTSRIKQQMKKNVGEKSVLKNVNFEVYQIFPRQPNDETKDKIQSLTQRYESEKKNLIRQNLILRQKLYDIREEIVGFAEWIDTNIFREQKPSYKNKFVINHNLLFKKQSLVAQLNEILQNARSGISEVIKMYEQGRKSLISGRFSLNKIENGQQSDPKKFVQNLSPNKIENKGNQFLKKPSERISVARRNSEHEENKRSKNIPFLQLKKQAKTLEPNFEVNDDESELSMISHLSTNQIVAQNAKFEKWEILLGHDNDNE